MNIPSFADPPFACPPDPPSVIVSMAEVLHRQMVRELAARLKRKPEAAE
jgi:hypothetical protein